MSGHVITVCQSCAAGQAGMATVLRAALDEAVPGYDVRETDCMSGCLRPSTLAFRAEGKVAYLFGDITADDLGNLILFARLYAASADGSIADARPLGDLRAKAIARIPG